MSIVSIILVCFSVIGAIDCMMNNKWGLGKEWERGFHLMGTLSLSMIGMIVLAPFISYVLSPMLTIIAEKTVFDPSILAGSLLANDMGGATLAKNLASNQEIGYFNGLVVGSMMGCTISFTLPFAMGVVEKRQHRLVLFGLMCGIIAIPIGCFVAGIVAGISWKALFLDLIPLVILALILSIGLMRIPEVCIKIFRIFGLAIKIVILIGMAVGIVTFLTGYELLPHTAPIEEGALIVFNAVIVMTGAFPLLHIMGRILRRPLIILARVSGLNDISTLGFIASLATSVTTFSTMKNMDDKGVVLNSAFVVSGAFVFADHLAFTMSFQADFLASVIVGKLTAGMIAIVIAWLMYPMIQNHSA